MFGNQRPAAPWSQHHWWGQYDTPADLPNVAAAPLQLGTAEVQAGDVAWSRSDAQLYVCIDGTPGAAVWRGLLSGSTLSGTVHYYLAADAANASDTGPGTQAEPLATLGEAIDRLNRLSRIGGDPVILHVATAAVPYDWDRALGPIDLGAPLFITGDGAGQAGDNGFTVVSSGTAQAGSGIGTLVITAGPFAANAAQGLAIRMTSGAAVGDMRSIRSNTTTDLIPTREFSGAVAAGDTYQIVRPSVRVTVPDAPDVGTYSAQVQGIGQASPLENDYYQATAPALYLVNLGFDGNAAGNGFAAFSISRSSVVFVGTEFDPVLSGGGWQYMTVIADRFSAIQGGVDYTALYSALGAPVDAGLVGSDTAWAGWGLVARPYRDVATQAVTFSFDGFRGMLCAEYLYPLGGSWWLLGGSVIYAGVTISLSPAMVVSKGSRVHMGEWQPFVGAIPFYVRSEEATTTREVAIAVNDDSYLDVVHALIEKDGQGFAIGAGPDLGMVVHTDVGPGVVSLAGNTGLVNINGSGGATYGLVARGGSRITFADGYLVMSGWPVNQQTAVWKTRVQDGGPVIAQDLAAYVAHGDAITNGFGAYIERN